MESFEEQIEGVTSVIELIKLSKELKKKYDPEKVNAAVAAKRFKLLGSGGGTIKELKKVYIMPADNNQIGSILDIEFKETKGSVLRLSQNGHIEFC